MQTGFFSMLLVAFIVLKLTGTVAWSWWWVLAPFWVPLIVVMVLFGVALLAQKKGW